MAANRLESAKPGAEAASERPTAAAAAPVQVGAGGGIKPWLPLMANLLLMPVLSFGTFHFLILPKMRPAQGEHEAITQTTSNAEERPGVAGGKSGGQVTVPLGSKVLVNVAGTMGTRYLLAQLSLVGSNPDLKSLIDKHDAALRDAACSALSVKTIVDLEKAGARNLIRTELVSVFNNILGEGSITDIYLTEFAVQ
jgi:flagellar FliL protein